MLDKNALSQLSQLKDEIRASKVYGEGVVAGSNGKFGFVRLDEGGDAFLSPEKMQHLLPGDRVKVVITKNEKGQLEATVEQLLEAPLQRFLGQYRVKGNAHFAVPLGNNPSNKPHQKPNPINRWIFLPPKMRGKCHEGDFIVAKLEQHPFKDGKTFARVIERIGQEHEAYIEHRFTTAKFDLTRKFGENAKKQMKEIGESWQKEAFCEGREDLSHIPFVTIDAETTKDMDDAIAIEPADEEGKQLLHVAIADPSHFIPQGSPLAFGAQYYMQSLYLIGGTLPMLPEQLSNKYFSLLPGEKRPVLLCSIRLNGAEVESYDFKFALITSHHKLSYQKVGEFLAGQADDAVPDACKDMLKMLQSFSAQRQQYRREHYLLTDEQIDYDYRVDDKGKISEIKPRTRTLGHVIVEEAMVITNICAGEFLKSHNQGLHTVHPGFREDRIGEVNALLKEESISNESINELSGHLTLLRSLAANPEKAYLVPALRRLMQGTSLTTQPGPHMGMGVPHYATITSPIRRFADLYNHWSIAHVIEQSKFRPLNEKALENITENLQAGRQADRELSQWLICQFAAQHIGFEGKAKIRIVTQQGFGARLFDNGIDGFVLVPKDQKKSFDAKRMTIELNDRVYRLEEEVTVKIVSVDMDKRRVAFALA